MESRESNQIASSLLERSLSPLWKVTYYCGILFDWCHPLYHKSCILIALHCFIIAVGFLTTTYQMACFAVPLSSSFLNSNSKIQEVVGSANDFITLLTILIIWAHFLCHRNPMLSFFQDWSLHQSALISPKIANKYFEAQLKDVRKFTFGIYFIFVILYFPLVILSTYNDVTTPLSLDEDIIISYYPFLAENVFFRTLKRFALVAEELNFILFYFLLDIVPILVYYHSTKNIKAIEIDVKMMIKTIEEDDNVNISKGLKLLWSRYENLRMLLHRADNIFGPLVVMSHGLAFFIICTAVYSLLNMIKNPEEIPPYPYLTLWIGLYLIINVSRLMIGLFVISRVECSSRSLLSSVACLSLRRCLDSEKEERRVTKSFLGRLENNSLAAHPCGFYTVTPSVGLTLLSLIVTYTIILLQTNNSGISSACSITSNKANTTF